MKYEFKSWLASLALAFFAAPASAVTVDILILYDSYTNTYFNNQTATAMKSWVDQMNTFNVNSQVDVQWRLVGVEAHEDSGTSMDTVLRNISTNSWVAQRRAALGADYVSQLHKTGACGIGWVAVDKAYAFSVVGPNCGPNAMAHELGHNMGLNHSRRQGDTGGTRYAYGLGYGVDGKFATMMAYESLFNAPKIPKYSNPNITCAGSPCGVPIGQPTQAFAAQAINNVKTEIAGFFPTVVTGGGGATGNAGVSVFQNANYGGYTATLAPGSYVLADLNAKGILNDDLSSARVPSGFTLELYADNNFLGTKTVYTADVSLFPAGVNDTTSSIIVRATTIANGVYELRVKHTGYCMDLRQSSPVDGAGIDQWGCNFTAAQYWQFTDTGGGKYEIKSTSSGKCLDVTGISIANGALFQQWTCARTNNQLFYVLANGDGTVRLQAVHSGRVADVSDGSTVQGASIRQWDWVGGNNQRWTMRRVQ